MQPSFMSNMTLDEKQNGCDKSKMGTIGSKMGRKFEQKKKSKMGKKKKSKFGQGLATSITQCSLL